MNPLQLTDRSIAADRSVGFFTLGEHLSGNAHVIPQKLAKKGFLMPVPLTEGKAFHVPFVMGIVVSGIAAVRGAAAAVDAPNFEGTAEAHRAENRIMAPEVAGPRTASHPIQCERDCRALPGGFALR